MANHLTALRKKAGFDKVKDASKALNCSSAMIYAAENGYKIPSPELGAKMSQQYKCTMDDIFLPFYTTISNN